MGKVFDPLNLAQSGSDATLAWFRAAELKHGRVAMAAFVGYVLTSPAVPGVPEWFGGYHWPGAIDEAGTTFESLGYGREAWEAISDAGRFQIVLFVGMLEIAGESAKPHYMKGGKIGTS